MASEKAPQSYYLQRLKELGITPKINIFKVPWTEISVTKEGERTLTKKPETRVWEHPLFEADDNDNIKINYYDLTGRQFEWRKEGERTRRKYFRTRLKVPRKFKNEEGKDVEMKYHQSKGSGHLPYFTPRIIEKFIDKVEIETLFIIEGEFKAFKGSMAGMDIIGIPSIHGFYSNDVPGKLHEDIQELVIGCKVKKLVYLTDADTLSVNWEEGKDLKKRPLSFHSAVKNFRNSLQLMLDSDEIELGLVYFMHMKTSLMDESKGLDDLLCNLPAKSDAILADALQLDYSKEFFSGINITDNRYSVNLNKYFGIGSVEDFYKIYQKFIGSREFRWGKSRYQWDGDQVSHVRHEDADQYFRVGSDWMKVIRVPNKNNEMEQEIIPFKISEITRDYRRHPDFIDQLERFDAFCNIPNWNGEYKRKYGECYNICNPINHTPEPGAIETTIMYLKHLFGGEGSITQHYDESSKEYHFEEKAELGDPFTVALDYLTIQYQQPTHKLPVPILVSPEQGTGKSTFLKWLRAIYGSNATILDNDRFKMNFNAHYITKFIIGLDEGFLDIEKKAEKEKLKQIATADEAFLENKGMNVKRFPYYGKLIICSNDADKVMQMDPEDRRWFVNRVPKLSKKDPFLEEKIKKEIPAWLHFLQSRKIHHPKEDDLWFRTEYIITDQFRKIVETTKNYIDKKVESFLKDMFLTYRVATIRMDVKTMLKVMNDPKVAKYKTDEKDLVYFLEERKHLKREHVQRFKVPIGYDAEGVGMLEEKCHARPFVFNHEDWLNPEELEEFKSDRSIGYMELHKPGSKSDKLTEDDQGKPF